MRSTVFMVGIVALAALLGSGCPSRRGVAEKGPRTLGIKANLGHDGDYNKTFEESVAAGSETQEIPLDWNELETAPGKFEPVTNFLAIANHYYPARGTPVHLMIRPVHTNQNVMPADLHDKPLDHPETIARFGRLLDWIATQVPQLDLASIAIGSEVDVYAWGDPERWSQWTRFYAGAAVHARKRFPGTMIACETTHHAFVGNDLERVRELHRHGDAIGVSYYPMAGGLRTVKPPKTVHQDFDAVVRAIPDKPILYYQIGYPSSPLLGSSPKQQSAFITETFRAWDRHATRILLLNFQWMHETPKAGLDHFATFYENDDPHFRAFLGSIGLQSWSGEPKPAWGVLTEEAKARGFGRFR